MGKKLEELDPTDTIKALVIGESGAGKTVFGAGFPGPVQIADFDNKISSAAGFYKGTDQIKQVNYESYPPVDQKGTSAQRFNEDLTTFRQQAEKGEIKTFVLDSLTTFSDEVHNYLMRMNPGIKRNVTKGAQAPALQDYGIARLFIKQIVMSILSWPCNIVFTAHIQVDKDETTGEIIRSPMLVGKLAKELPIYFPEVYRAFVKDGKHWAQTQSDNKFHCRTQIRGLDKIVPLSYKSLVG